jgi:hypothetical protein
MQVALASTLERAFGYGNGLLLEFGASRPSVGQPMPRRPGVGIRGNMCHLAAFVGVLAEGFAVVHRAGSSTSCLITNNNCGSRVPEKSSSEGLHGASPATRLIYRRPRAGNACVSASEATGLAWLFFSARDASRNQAWAISIKRTQLLGSALPSASSTHPAAWRLYSSGLDMSAASTLDAT